MRRAERLFRILQVMRRTDRPTTAEAIAHELEVSKRTVYRDIAHLIGSGVAIEGEAGVGYVLGERVDLPPLSFTFDQIDALVLGVQAVAMLADEELALAGREALQKIESVLPKEHSHRVRTSRVLALRGDDRPPAPRRLSALRKAVHDGRKLRLAYSDVEHEASERVVRPLAVTTFGVHWLLVAWCELRADFRTFRIDRILHTEPTGEAVPAEPGRMLGDYLARVAAGPMRG